MRTPPHPSFFSDIRPLLDAALAAGGAAYRPLDPHRGNKPSRQAAIRFRHRAYALRRALQYQASTDPYQAAQGTPYDSMVLTIDPQDETRVLINAKPRLGLLEDLDGNPLPIGARPIVEPSGDPLLDQARQVAKELGLE